jgi:hypothetical protein
MPRAVARHAHRNRPRRGANSHNITRPNHTPRGEQVIGRPRSRTAWPFARRAPFPTRKRRSFSAKTRYESPNGGGNSLNHAKPGEADPRPTAGPAGGWPHARRNSPAAGAPGRLAEPTRPRPPPQPSRGATPDSRGPAAPRRTRCGAPRAGGRYPRPTPDPVGAAQRRAAPSGAEQRRAAPSSAEQRRAVRSDAAPTSRATRRVRPGRGHRGGLHLSKNSAASGPTERARRATARAQCTAAERTNRPQNSGFRPRRGVREAGGGAGNASPTNLHEPARMGRGVVCGRHGRRRMRTRLQVRAIEVRRDV